MTTHVDKDIREWLEAEAAGLTDEADARFRPVSRRLAPAEVPAWFTAAVMARLGYVRAAQDVYAKRWVRVAVAASVALVGGVAALVPAHAWVAAMLTSVQMVAMAVGRGLVLGRAWLGGGLALWSGLAEAAVVVGRQLMGPVPLGLLALNLAVALCAFTALRRLMALQEN